MNVRSSLFSTFIGSNIGVSLENPIEYKIGKKESFTVLIEILPAHKIKYFRFRTRCAGCSILIHGSNGYAGRDPQGGTSDGSVCKIL